MTLIAIAWLLSLALFVEAMARAPQADEGENLPGHDHYPRHTLALRAIVPVVLACIAGALAYLY
ncbi:hypothetical protein [Salinarimonas soli]|uniref:Uncharacterized protein n=1 Tax=Salinarimonas soli TaxID=1638099 RepID=A0A5B2VAZ6_9HYPH|nr:hypothetical protein [Salinarimonas soli]KAA2235946.1 hypothetical protein F0L46_17430 [Salinarimonas soli]